MQPVCCRSLSELRIIVCTKLKDAATLSWPGLFEQVLPSRDSCWFAGANRCGRKFKPGQGRTALHQGAAAATSVAAAEQLGAALAAEQLEQPAAEGAAAWQLTVAAAAEIKQQQGSYINEGQSAAAAATTAADKGPHMYTVK